MLKAIALLIASPLMAGCPWMKITKTSIPKEQNTVIVWGPGLPVTSAILVRDFEKNTVYWVTPDGNAPFQSITHWQPMPKQPAKRKVKR